MNQCGGCGVEMLDPVRTNCGPACANKMANENLAGRLVRVAYSTRDGDQFIIGSMSWELPRYVGGESWATIVEEITDEPLRLRSVDMTQIEYLPRCERCGHSTKWGSPFCSSECASDHVDDDAAVEVEARMDREEPGWRDRDAARLREMT